MDDRPVEVLDIALDDGYVLTYAQCEAVAAAIGHDYTDADVLAAIERLGHKRTRQEG